MYTLSTWFSDANSVLTWKPMGSHHKMDKRGGSKKGGAAPVFSKMKTNNRTVCTCPNVGASSVSCLTNCRWVIRLGLKKKTFVLL